MIIEIFTGSDFAGLDHYLTHDRDHEIVATRGVSGPDEAAAEMALVAAERADVLTPALHAVFSPAPEDQEKMTGALWREIETAFEDEFGLTDHQKLVVQHPDTSNLHRHAGFNKVHPETFELPVRPESSIGRSSGKIGATWDTAMKMRAWEVCDNFARRHGLRRVPKPTEMEREVRVPVWALKREERLGSRPVAELGSEIREALQVNAWDGRIAKLAPMGLVIKPYFERAIKGAEVERVIGIRIVAADDPTNFVKGSALGKGFSFAALERSRDSASPDLITALESSAETRMSVSHVSSPMTEQELYRLEYEAYRRGRKREERRASRARERLSGKEAAEEKKLSDELSAELRSILGATPRAFHRQARTMLSLLVAQPQRSELAKAQAEARRSLRLSPLLKWKEWLSDKGEGGDVRAVRLLNEMAVRHARHGHRAKKPPIRESAKDTSLPQMEAAREMHVVPGSSSPAFQREQSNVRPEVNSAEHKPAPKKSSPVLATPPAEKSMVEQAIEAGLFGKDGKPVVRSR